MSRSLVTGGTGSEVTEGLFVRHHRRLQVSAPAWFVVTPSALKPSPRRPLFRGYRFRRRIHGATTELGNSLGGR